MIKMWAQLSQEEQSLLLLFNHNVYYINLQPDILESYFNMVEKLTVKETSSHEVFLKNTLKLIENIGFGEFDKTTPTLFKLNPSFAAFLKQQAKTLSEADRLFIQSAYVNLYEGIAHTYHTNSLSNDTFKNRNGFRWLMAEFDNILQAFIISTSLEKVAIHCFFSLNYIYSKFNNHDARFKLIQYLDKVISEKDFIDLSLYQQKVLLTRHESLSILHIDKTDYKSAINTSNLGINILKNAPINKDYTSIIYSLYNSKAIAHFRLKELDQAFNLFQQIEVYYLKINHPNISSIHLNMGMVSKDMGENDKAIKYYKKALKGDVQNSTLLSIYLNLGDVCREVGKINEAKEHYEKYFENLHDNYDFLSQGKAHHNLGMIATQKEDFKLAREHYNSAINLYHNSSKYHLGRLFSDLGILESFEGNYQDSITYFNKALTILNSSQDKTLVDQISMNLFLPYIYLKNHPMAIETCEIVLNNCKGNQYVEAINYTRLAIAYSIGNEDSIAQRYCHLAINQIHLFNQVQMDFLIKNIEDFSKLILNKSYIMALKQYFVTTRKKARK